MSTSAHTAASGSSVSAGIRALVQLTKPGITRMVLVTAGAGALVAPGSVDLGLLVWTLLGTAFVVGAANALNMYLERDVDGLMERTKSRPLPEGRISPEVALWFGIGLAITGLVLLGAVVNGATALLGGIALLSYVLVYTPMKRVTPFALHVGAVPGAIPPLIGWAGMTGSLSWEAVPLFAILLVWQLPHFLAISLFRRNEYQRAQLHVYANAYGVTRTWRSLVAYAGLLWVASLTPLFFGTAGTLYGVCAIVIGALYVYLAGRGLWQKPTAKWARVVFFASMPHLVAIYGLLVAFAL